ncbi:MAG TPA: sulfur transferase domain-containing protein [Vicinamibacterales bacterium]|jgi:uncharacterized protein (TIGR01244 family)|nr:sulfur transferase domain-containing protein [Vicinamibacterales bacterium]
MKLSTFALMTILPLIGSAASAQQVTKESRDGIKNFARVETTVACAGAITVDAMPEIKKMGFVSVINLREAQEPGADIETQRAAAQAAGLRYYHVPMNTAKPDPKVADEFIKVVTSKEAAPAFIHCASANRASAMWMIKRIVVDHWDVDRASAEAEALGLTNATLKQWALEYARAPR